MSIKTGLRIEASPTPQTVDQIASGLIGILQAGFDAHAEQSTIQVALQAFGRATQAAPTNVTNCNFDGADRIQN